MAKFSLKDFVLGVFATALAAISMGIFIRLTWKGWDSLIECLVNLGFQPEIEYVIGVILFILACWIGLVQLKKIKTGKH